jgi:hypothetical protein
MRKLLRKRNLFMPYDVNFFGTAEKLKEYTASLAWLESENWQPVSEDEHP